MSLTEIKDTLRERHSKIDARLHQYNRHDLTRFNDEWLQNAEGKIDTLEHTFPNTFCVNEWNVWDKRRERIRPEVFDWLEQNVGLYLIDYNFFDILNEWGVIGLKNDVKAVHFKISVVLT